MEKLEIKDNGMYITKGLSYSKLGTIQKEIIEEVFDFAFSMSFGKEGEHRSYRSGGSHKRKNGEIFANAFQGKLAEFAFYKEAIRYGLLIDKPDLSVWELGKWDDSDFIVKGKNINIKSTKSYGNLLLLETKDWDKRGRYIPNIKKGLAVYDYFILIRMNPFCEEILKLNKILYSEKIDKEELRKIIIKENWGYDIPGWISHRDLVNIINDDFIIKKDDMLNGITKMDAENYYVQSGDMKDIKLLINILKNIAIK